MSASKRCPQCQAEIPAGSPEGLCPACLLQAGLASKPAEGDPATAPYSSSGTTFVPPAPATLQAAFPQLEILELLGKGGMGAVYKARQPGLDRFVAVKILPPEISRDPAFAERFTREARALAKLSHPNIVGVFDFGEAGGYCYFVMEYIDGVNLRQAMRSGDLKAAEALKIVPQICDALQFAHDEGVVHRDIKPENILLDKKGRVKIADFGLAKLLGKAPLDVSLTGTRQVMGTVHYMAPEQMTGSRDVDHRADIYSLGVTFYEMLTGELPLGRFAPPSKMVQIDVRLDEVVLRSLEREPAQRYQNASEIRTEMDTISRGPVPASAAPKPIALDEHPFLKAMRFWMTPQPLYARMVGIPIIILTGLHMLVIIANLANMMFGDQAAEEMNAAFLCGSLSVLGLAAIVLHILYLVAASRRAAAALRNESNAQAPPPIAPRPVQGPVKPPMMVPILGAMNVLVAVFSLFMVTYGFFDWDNLPAEIKTDERMMQIYAVYMTVETAVGYLGSVAWFAAGIGMMLWLSWARRLTVAIAVVNLAWFILTIPAQFAFTIQPAFAGVPEVAGADPAEQFGYAMFMACFLIGAVVLVLAYDIAVLIYLTRPRVIAAFNAASAPDSAVVEPPIGSVPVRPQQRMN